MNSKQLWFHGVRPNVHYITHSKKFPGNQGKHKNFDPAILPYKTIQNWTNFGLIFMRMKQKKNEEKNPKWLIFQNGRFSKSPILKNFSRKFYCLFLPLHKNKIGPIEIFVCCILTLLSLCPVGCLSLEKLN